jgi:hypothetical protein
VKDLLSWTDTRRVILLVDSYLGPGKGSKIKGNSTETGDSVEGEKQTKHLELALGLLGSDLCRFRYSPELKRL